MPLHENLPHAFVHYTKQVDNFVVDGTIISNMYMDLTEIPHANAHVFVVLNGILITEGVSNDYTITGDRITLNNGLDIELNESFMIAYQF